MTNEDAIKWLENLKQDIGQLRHENLWPYAQAIEEIMELLKEQEAVKPRVSSVEQRCGHCNKVIEMDGWKVCPWCGKMIDWERWWQKNGTCNQDT